MTKPSTQASYTVVLRHDQVNVAKDALNQLGINFNPKDTVLVYPRDEPLARGTFKGNSGPYIINALNQNLEKEEAKPNTPKIPRIDATWDTLSPGDRADILTFAAYNLDWPAGGCLGLMLADWFDFVHDHPAITNTSPT